MKHISFKLQIYYTNFLQIYHDLLRKFYILTQDSIDSGVYRLQSYKTKRGGGSTSAPFIIDSYLSSRAATPGRTFPSINSNDAPPPVET